MFCKEINYLEISGWVFLSPSTVNGEAPVNNSNVKTPRLHQSTVYQGRKKMSK